MDCFRFSLPCQFTTSRFISHHTWRFCTPERATIAIAVISTLTFKPFSIFFYPLNRSFSIFFFLLFYLVHFVPHFSSYLGSFTFAQQPPCAKCLVSASSTSAETSTKGVIYGTNNLLLFTAEQLDLQVSRDGCTNPLCSIQMTSKE